MATASEKPNKAAASEAEMQITLDEFCMRQSKTDKRVELIGGFHSDQIRASHFKDTESEFRSRFEAFINKPV